MLIILIELCFHIKLQIMKDLSSDIICIYEIIYVIIYVYHYIAANKLLLNTNHYSVYKCC